MLAPRQKLWSTPFEVVDKAIEVFNLTESDLIYDVGAGDGRFIIRCAQKTAATCVGIEIEDVRFAATAQEISKIGLDSSRCRLIHGNALDMDFSAATAFYLYLCPRGLRKLLPLIMKSIECHNRDIKIITYTCGLPDITPVRIEKVCVASHPGAEWPIYYYELKGNQATSEFDIEVK